jgi:hypothetical protein
MKDVFHEEFYNHLLEKVHANERLREANRELQDKIDRMSQYLVKGGGVIGRIARDVRGIVDITYSPKRRKYVALIRSPYKKALPKYRNSKDKFAAYNRLLDEENRNLKFKNIELRKQLRDLRARLKQRWFDTISTAEQNENASKTSCTYAGLMQVTGTCWMNAMLNALFLCPEIRLLLWKKWVAMPLEYKRKICGPHYDFAMDRPIVKGNRKLHRVPAADAGTPCASYETCVCPPGDAEGSEIAWTQAVHRAVFGLFVNLVASWHARRPRNDQDPVLNAAALVKLHPKFFRNGPQWNPDASAKFEQAIRDWNAHRSDGVGGNDRAFPLLVRAVLEEELDKKYIVVVSNHDYLDHLSLTYTELDWCVDVGADRKYFVKTLPARVVIERGRMFRLASATIELLWNEVPSNTDPKKEQQLKGHAIAGFHCRKREYTYDSNSDTAAARQILQKQLEEMRQYYSKQKSERDPKAFEARDAELDKEFMDVMSQGRLGRDDWTTGNFTEYVASYEVDDNVLPPEFRFHCTNCVYVADPRKPTPKQSLLVRWFEIVERTRTWFISATYITLAICVGFEKNKPLADTVASDRTLPDLPRFTQEFRAIKSQLRRIDDVMSLELNSAALSSELQRAYAWHSGIAKDPAPPDWEAQFESYSGTCVRMCKHDLFEMLIRISTALR